MRVLMFGWEFPPHISGGLGTACFELTHALAQQGVDVVFVAPHAPPATQPSPVTVLSAADIPTPRRATTPRAILRRLNIRMVNSLLRPYLKAADYPQVLRTHRQTPADDAIQGLFEGGDNYGENLLAEVVRYSEIGELLAQRESFDVIHTHDWMTLIAGLRAKRVSGKPWIAHMHALELDRSGEHPDRNIVRLEQMGMAAADHIIAVSHYTRGLIIEQYGIPADKVSVVHNAVARRHADRVYHVKRTHRERIVLFLGRITFQKGPEYFVEAAARVLEKVPNVTFVMAGAGDMLPRMISRVAQLRIGRHFHFTGFLRGAEVERMYAMSDVYVMPSVSEPFGISPLEAMLCDVPVIVSRHSGVSEVLHHALKVDFWDVAEMANQIIAVLTYPALTRELLRNGRRELQALRWEVAAEKTAAVYHRLCS